MTATIYDVASQAGVSIATVSRVLNVPHSVNSSTRARVQAAIDALGFVPKAEASARARRRHRQVGVLVPFFTYSSFVQRLRGIAGALLDAGYELVVYNAETPEHVRGYLLSLPITRRLDGLIIISLRLDDEASRRLNTHGLPAVLIETHNDSLSCVDIDNRAGGALAADYLIRRGTAASALWAATARSAATPGAQASCGWRVFANGWLRRGWNPASATCCRTRPRRTRRTARRWPCSNAASRPAPFLPPAIRLPWACCGRRANAMYACRTSWQFWGLTI